MSQLSDISKLIWQDLLRELRGAPNNSDTYFYQSDFSSIAHDNTLFNYIEQNADLENYNIEDLKDQDFWNESVQDLIDFYCNYFDSSTIEETINYNNYSKINNGKIPLDEINFNSEDIKYADAGNSFNKIVGNNIPIWVKPWYNSEVYENDSSKLRSYYDVRGLDLNALAASNNKNLQFTVSQQQSQPNWLRLLMPMNNRRVEVEDLNRNFWVLSSVLSGICGYLFDENAPIPHMLKEISNEAIQLWENTIYLWTSIGIYNQSLVTNNRVEVVPLYQNNLQPYKKYDNFAIAEAALDEELIIEQVTPIITKYNDCNLCIIPYLRNNNYYQNYYSSETYLGIVLYNATTKNITYHDLKCGTIRPIFEPAKFGDYLYGFRENPIDYSYLLPIKEAGLYSDSDGIKHRYFAALRVIPTLDFYVNDNGLLAIKNFSLKAYDPALVAITGESEDNTQTICQYTQSNSEWNEESGSDFELNYDDIIDSSKPNSFGIRTAALNGEGLYLGELPSYSDSTDNAITYDIVRSYTLIDDGVLIKIGNFLPYNTTIMTDATWNNLIGEAVSSDNEKTGYELNFTMKGTYQTSDKISRLYHGLGSAYGSTPSQSHLFIPHLVNNEFKYEYNSDYALNYEEVTLQKLQSVGQDVIKEYIIKYYSGADRIVYFMGAIGTSPWHNTTGNIGNGVFQGYWKSNLLTHLFRYIPFSLKDYRNPTGTYEEIPDRGYLECLGQINKREEKFSNDYFEIRNGTTWRLPHLYGEPQIAGYLTVSCTQGVRSEYKYIDLVEYPRFKDMTDQQIIAEIQLNPNILKNQADITKELQNPRGAWTVYDGNNSNTAGNKFYNDAPQYRQVYEAHFGQANSIDTLTNTLGRKKNHTSFNYPDGIEANAWKKSIFTNNTQHYSANSWNTPAN